MVATFPRRRSERQRPGPGLRRRGGGGGRWGRRDWRPSWPDRRQATAAARANAAPESALTSGPTVGPLWRAGRPFPEPRRDRRIDALIPGRDGQAQYTRQRALIQAEFAFLARRPSGGLRRAVGRGSRRAGLRRKAAGAGAGARRPRSDRLRAPRLSLAEFGGLEIAMMGPDPRRRGPPARHDHRRFSSPRPAALAAIRLAPAARDYCVFAHASAELGPRPAAGRAGGRDPCCAWGEARGGDGALAFSPAPLVPLRRGRLSEVGSLDDVAFGGACDR